VLLLTSLVAYVIPDVPFKLQKQMRRERQLTNHMIINTELDRAQGHAGTVDLGDPVSVRSRAAENLKRTDYMAGSLEDDMELCTLTSGTDKS